MTEDRIIGWTGWKNPITGKMVHNAIYKYDPKSDEYLAEKYSLKLESLKDEQ